MHTSNGFPQAPFYNGSWRFTGGVVDTMLTLNIIEHELRAYGHVVRTYMDNLSFFGFRLFIENGSIVDSDVLYLCSTRADVTKAVKQGLAVIYINSSDIMPDDRAVLSVLQGESILVVFNALLAAASRYDKWEREMDAIQIRGGELQELLDTVTPFLHKVYGVQNVTRLSPAFYNTFGEIDTAIACINRVAKLLKR